MIEEALSLAKEGFSIFPLHRARIVDDIGTVLCTCGGSGNIKDDDTCKGKHPRNGVQPSVDATTDPVIIRRWWEKWQNAPIGIHLGKSHTWALDIDPRHGGDVSFQKMIERYGALPETRVVKTGGGGFHYYFAAWSVKINNGTLSEYPGIDIKGNHGTAYVVSPPSDHVSGGMYEYVNRVSPVDAPDWLLMIVQSGKPTPDTEKTSLMKGVKTILSREIPITRLLTDDQMSRLHREGNTFMGSHPLHGSTTGRNFQIDTIKNRWRCFRHQSSGGLFELAAVQTGLCKCEEFSYRQSGIRKNPLSGKNFERSIKAALDLGVTRAELEIHLKIVRSVA